MMDKFENYLKDGRAKKKMPDMEEAKSLLDKAGKRINYTRELNKDTASLVLEDAYEASREAAQALMSKNGFKPYSHEATISFLKEFYNKELGEYEISELDRFRNLRNNSIYKAKEMEIGDALKCLEFSKKFIEKIKKLII